jgi:DNA-binding protein Fis
MEALKAARGNQTLAAALIEMPLRTFVAKLKQFGIDSKSLR